MVGITNFGGYVPAHRLGPWTANWEGQAARSVANFDEDAITLAFAGLEDCLRQRPSRDDIDALYLASTTLPYDEKSAGVVVATAAGLPATTQTSDVTQSLRAGSEALVAAFDAVASGRIRNAAVVASDCRVASPGSTLERTFGDGSGAVVAGTEGVVAEFDGYVSIADDIHAVWRTSGDRAVTSWEERFVVQEGYLQSMRKLGEAIRERLGVEVAAFDRVVLVAADARRQAEALRALGLEKERIAESLTASIGSTGSAHALMELSLALETARPGERVLVINYGDGADAIALRVTGEIERLRATRPGGVRRYIDSTLEIASYLDYLKWRGFLQQSSGVRRPAGGGPSAAALHREQDQVLRFNAVRCGSCKAVMYPPQRLCIECRAQDNFEKVRLVNEPARLFTYSMDYIAGTLDVPLVLGVVDFENGARAVLMMTDREIDQVAIDMPLEMTLRIARGSETMPNYYWKCMPVRAAAVAEAAAAG